MARRYGIKVNSPAELEEIKSSFIARNKKYRHTVMLCGGAGCVSSHCAEIEQAFKKCMALRGLRDEVRLVVTGCIGLCALGPIAVVEPEGVFYCELTPEKVRELVDRHLIGGSIKEEYTYFDKETGKHIPHVKDIGYFSEQVKIALRNCGRIDYSSIENYIAEDGYFAIAKALQGMERAQVVEELKKSGLRGRGGAGFPTGRKWESGMNMPGGQKYLICNADEGDPGAFMDRSLLEGDPHNIIEAMLLGGYTIGANRGYVYVRAEYPLAVERLTDAIEQAREAGILGEHVMGSDFAFDVEIRIGAGAFVCGEETALINSIEGRRGEPRQKPPFPFEKGLWGCPTIINNVETLASVPAIILRGGDWYAQYGVGASKGTKVFALAGDIVNSGIIEVPMGTKLDTIINKIGGGMKDGKAFKAVQSGGPSGGCIPAQYIDVSMDYESLTAMGAIMGSGGLIAMDEDTCLVDTARYFMDFVQDESCGHCVPCRLGTKRMLEILERITGGEGTVEDVQLLEILANTVRTTAMCGLGQTSPNPVLTTLRYFRDEYMTHVLDKKCPAHVCKRLFKYEIDPDKCRGCGLCAKNCPTKAISGKTKEPHVIDHDLCVKCGTCHDKCPFGAVAVV